MDASWRAARRPLPSEARGGGQRATSRTNLLTNFPRQNDASNTRQNSNATMPSKAPKAANQFADSSMQIGCAQVRTVSVIVSARKLAERARGCLSLMAANCVLGLVWRRHRATSGVI
jgi:hypothetical protein